MIDLPSSLNDPVLLHKPTDEANHKRSHTDKRIDFLLKKHFEEDLEFRPVIVKLAEYDPTPNKKYLAWLVKHWCGKWNPDDAELQCIAHCLNIHHRGAKYFSPLRLTGMVLESTGYQSDVFRFTPQTILQMQGKISEIIQTDEEDKEIRKGNVVATAGTEVAYQDDSWTLVRIRTNDALERLGQHTSWCVRHGGVRKHCFPFDLLLSCDGKRYLAKATQVRDRWDRLPPPETVKEISRIRLLGSDKGDKKIEVLAQFASTVQEAIQSRRRLKQIEEEKLIQYPEWAIEYAAAVIGGPWTFFERKLLVKKFSASLAVEYAIRCLRKRWPRFENMIAKSVEPLARYRQAFPGSIPKTDREMFHEEIQRWRNATKWAQPRPGHFGVQPIVEARERLPQDEFCIVHRQGNSLKRYVFWFASLVTSDAKRWYMDKLQSFFDDFTSELGQSVNLPIARLLCLQFGERIERLEPMIAKDSVCSLNYAVGIAERFPEGECQIRKDGALWEEYRTKVLGEKSE